MAIHTSYHCLGLVSKVKSVSCGDYGNHIIRSESEFTHSNALGATSDQITLHIIWTGTKWTWKDKNKTDESMTGFYTPMCTSL